MEWATFEETIKQLQLKEPYSETLITPDELIELLKDDVVHVLERPGSWEGSKMHDLLRAHGLIDFD